MNIPEIEPSLIARAFAGQISAEQFVQILRGQVAVRQRRHAAAVRRANRIDKQIVNLKREMEDHCRGTGHARRAELIHFDLTVLLAERDRLSRAVPTLDDELLEQLADDYDAADARKAAAKAQGSATEEADPAAAAEPTGTPVHIHLPDDADPAAFIEAVKAELGDEVKG